MKQIDIVNIKEMTNQKIAFAVYEREEKMRFNKWRSTLCGLGIFGILLGGMLTVNATTDNGVVEAVKGVLQVTINNNEYNAKCDKDENGQIVCSVDDADIGEGVIITYDIPEDEYDNGDAETPRIIVSAELEN